MLHHTRKTFCGRNKISSLVQIYKKIIKLIKVVVEIELSIRYLVEKNKENELKDSSILHLKSRAGKGDLVFYLRFC